MKLPVELFELIVEDVTESSDLLSFGLTCKLLADIILPRHLYYHTISASIYRGQLWVYLAMNPQICRYIRRLEVSTRHHPKMRLSVQPAGHMYQYHGADLPQVLFIRALREMVNLKAFTWKHDRTPLLPEDSDLAREYPNLHWRHISKHSTSDGVRYASLFDISPIIVQLRSLVSITLISEHDPPYLGSSLSIFVRNCHQLEYLNLTISEQCFAGELFTSCRWPNLKVLILCLRFDSSDTLTRDSIEEFFVFHSKIVSLKWDDDRFSPYSVLPLNCLPNLKSLEGDDVFVRSIVSAPCIPPRRLEKVMNYPSDTELWENPEISFQGIDRHSLKIISFKFTSLTQMTEFGLFFRNVECVDIREKFPNGGVWDVAMKRYRRPVLAEYAESVSSFRSLRVILGIQFFDESQDEEENQRRLSWISEILPHLEFCMGADSISGIALIHDGNSIRLGYGLSERDNEFVIFEEHDHHIL